MRKNFGAKPWLYPQPVLIIATYGEDGTPDAMNAAWGRYRGYEPHRHVSQRQPQNDEEHPEPQGIYRQHGGRGPRGRL